MTKPSVNNDRDQPFWGGAERPRDKKRKKGSCQDLREGRAEGKQRRVVREGYSGSKEIKTRGLWKAGSSHVLGRVM